MRRVVPQKVQPAADQSYSGESVDSSKLVSPGVARRARTSAAMIGLAISMGASGLLLPRHDGRAMAAEPQSAEAESAPAPTESSSDLPAASDASLVSPSPAEAGNSSGALDKVQDLSPTGDVEQLRLDRENSLERLRRQRSQLEESLSNLRVSPEAVDSPESPAPKALTADTTPEVLPPEVSETVLYRVKPGDTLASIALAHGVSTQTLIALNDLQNPNFLRVHQVLRVPQVTPDVVATRSLTNVVALASPEVQAPQAVRPAVMTAAPASAHGMVHRVAPGETVAAIARAYRISQAALIAENKLTNPNLIRVGQTLQIPTAAVPEQSASLPLTVAHLPERNSNNSTLVKDAISEVPALEVATVPPGTLDDMPRPEPIGASNGAVFSTEFISVETEAPEVSEVVPPVEVGSAALLSAMGERNLYASQLVSEVSSLQERYGVVDVAPEVQRPEAAIADSVEVASASAIAVSVSQPIAVIAPEAARGGASPLSPQELQERAIEPKADAFADGVVALSPEPQVVAAAPIGSESYAPLLEPVVGRMVSPELPPLPAADAFLPEGSNIFAGYAWPARGVLTSGYGPRWGRMHRGIDIAAPVGTPVYAAAPGVIEFAGWNSGGYGYMVDIRHADGSMTRYAHNSRLLVQRGQEVAQGEQISEMGSTGYSTGPHLHFEIHLPQRGAVNPMTLLASR